MREALAAADHDFIVADAPQPRRHQKRGAARKARRGRLGAPRLNLRRIGRFALVAFCSAALAGVALNALILQKTRHPAPLFGHRLPAAAAKKTPESEAASPAPVPAAPPQSQAEAESTGDAGGGKGPTDAKPARPHAAASDATEAAPPRDAISRLLSGKSQQPEPAPQPAHPAKTVLAAQKALLKLGFVLKADGVLGATTRQAIERYERDHGRAGAGELTPAVSRRLAAESGVPVN